MRLREWLFGMRLRVLRVRPGDAVLLETDLMLSDDDVRAIKRQWDRRLPSVPMVLMTGGLHASGVVRNETEEDVGVAP